ncbi:MAG: DUF1073 domain-containing protein [Candidatus Obscuribacterales bacterium]|jgi:hypothetical protein
MWPFRKPQEPKTAPAPVVIDTSEFTPAPKIDRKELLKDVIKRNFGTQPSGGPVATMDYAAQNFGTGLTFGQTIPDTMVEWYGNQSFIGFQACMILAQNWLINAACEIPVDDALRKGHEIHSDDGADLDAATLSKLNAFNKDIDLMERMTNFGKFARVFGYRIAIFKIESDDPDYYENPFNPDGITKDSYKGISMPDPYYVTPQLSSNGFDPADPNFYEPEYWMVQGKKYHKSHVILFRHCTVPTLMKPVYMYGGISLVQQIYEKCYSAEQAGNEANRLLMTKRLMVRKGDVQAALLDQQNFEDKMNFFQSVRDNYGEQVIDTTEDLLQLETALAEVTNVIAQKYEHVAAVARMPANKLMQTQLQGFAASGEAEEAIYNGMLETLQEKCFTKFLERHYTCAIRSLGLAKFEFAVAWPPIDTITEAEQATINQTKAQTDQIHATVGALTGENINERLSKDKNSGYQGAKYDPPEIDYSNDNDPADSQTPTQDSSSIPAGSSWITLEDGQHVLIGRDGKVQAGAGGNLNGKYYGTHGTVEKPENKFKSEKTFKLESLRDSYEGKHEGYSSNKASKEDYDAAVEELSARSKPDYVKPEVKEEIPQRAEKQKLGDFRHTHYDLETGKKLEKPVGTNHYIDEYGDKQGDIYPIHKKDEMVKKWADRDNQSNSKQYSIERFSNGENKKESFNHGEYVNYKLGGKERFGEIEGISHANREVKVNGVWYDFGSVYKADKPEKIEPKKTEASKVIESFNKKHGSDLDDSDRVPL